MDAGGDGGPRANIEVREAVKRLETPHVDICSPDCLRQCYIDYASMVTDALLVIQEQAPAPNRFVVPANLAVWCER